jgi:hypothetical protein
MAGFVEEAGIARADIAVRRSSSRRSSRVLVVAAEDRGRAVEHLAIVGDPDLDLRRGLPTVSALISPSGCMVM